jgi:hypothetical protein
MTVSAPLAASPNALFAQITDLSQLAAWNEAITDVPEAPSTVRSGSVWKVRIRAMGHTWVSRSEARVVDHVERRFAYRSQTDDGDPSYADWQWHIEPTSIGSKVTVSVDLAPRSFWRKHLLVHIRRPNLRREMGRSLSALERAVVAESRSASFNTIHHLYQHKDGGTQPARLATRRPH